MLRRAPKDLPRPQAAGYPVSIKIYDGAYMAGGDRTAWADAVERVEAFFAVSLR